MKVSIERVPEGIRLTLPSDSGSKPPTIVTLSPSQVAVVAELLRAAVKVDVFKLTWDSG